MFKQIFKLFKSDTLYNQALNECYEMLDIDLEMFQESIHVLRNQDDSKSKIDIAKTDIKINKPAWLNLVYLIANVAPINIIAIKNNGLDNSF